jgi:hypothetical protein
MADYDDGCLRRAATSSIATGSHCDKVGGWTVARLA